MDPLGPQKSHITIMVPTGALGAGVSEEHVERTVHLADAIACDAGSTDSGPFYLARATAKNSRNSVKHDLKILMAAARSADVPLLIGTCGTSGTDAGVNWTHDIVREIADAMGWSPRVALLYSEQDPAVIGWKLDNGQVQSLAPAVALDNDMIKRCTHIVALMGVEPYIEAIRQGAQIILGGRTTDTAVLAAVPLMLGASPGPAWHAAKTAECGALCTTMPRRGGVLMKVSTDDFIIEPMDPANSATPYSVSSHMLYENSHPFELIEPGGILNVDLADYETLDERVVRVTGSRWTPMPYTMKLEGASVGAFQSMMLIGVRDPKVLARLDEFEQRMLAALHARVAAMISDVGAYDIALRIYGWNAVSGDRPAAGTPAPIEVGILFIATAETQEMANAIAKTCNPHFFHFPIDINMELPSYAFPFSPAEVAIGHVCAFELNHVVHVDDPLELVRMAWPDNAGQREEFSHADA